MTISRFRIAPQFIVETLLPRYDIEGAKAVVLPGGDVEIEIEHFGSWLPAGDITLECQRFEHAIGGPAVVVTPKAAPAPQAAEGVVYAVAQAGQSAQQITRLFAELKARGGGFGAFVVPREPRYYRDLAVHLLGQSSRTTVGDMVEYEGSVVRFITAQAWNQDMVRGAELLAYDIDHAVVKWQAFSEERFQRAATECAYRICDTLERRGVTDADTVKPMLKPLFQSAKRDRVAEVLTREPSELVSPGLAKLLAADLASSKLTFRHDFGEPIGKMPELREISPVEVAGFCDHRFVHPDFEAGVARCDVCDAVVPDVVVKVTGKNTTIEGAHLTAVAHEPLRERPAPKPANGELTKAPKPEEKPERAQRDEAVHDAIRHNLPRDDRR